MGSISQSVLPTLAKGKRNDGVTRGAQFLNQLLLDIGRGKSHLRRGNLLCWSTHKAQFADTESTFFGAHRRAEGAAGHRPMSIQVARAGCRIEHRAGLVVAEIFESLERRFVLIENARLSVTRVGSRQAQDGRIDPGLDLRSALRVFLLQKTQTFAQPFCVQR